MTSPYHLTVGSPADLAALAPKSNPAFSGVVTLPPGTVAAPGAAFADDADTGVCRPAADTLALVTAGATRLRVTSGGAVVIGGDAGAPAARLSFGAAVGTDLLHLFDNGSNRYGLGIGGLPALQIYAPTAVGAVSIGGRSAATGTFDGESLRVTSVSSTVNRVQVTGAITTGAPTIAAQGSDANIHLRLQPKGTGTVIVATLPTSAAGLPSGALWNDGGTVKVA